MRELFYFAYGSNMSVRRLRARLQAIEAMGAATLDGHALVFHKVGRLDGSGKCGIVASADDRVHGALFRMDGRQRRVLDRIEGAGYGYQAAWKRIVATDGSEIEAYTYVPTVLDRAVRPFHWYRHHVLTGAREFELPRHYVERIERIDSIDDPDAVRAARELAIYR